MGQEPNIESSSLDLQMEGTERGAERRWKPSRPGEITSSADVPTGPSFGRPGPDTGWATRLLSATSYDRGDRPAILADLLTALMGARASAAGRGPVPQDVEVALSLVGLRSQDMDGDSLERLALERNRWLDAIAHEPSPGMAALADIDPGLLAETPVRVRVRLNAQPDLVSKKA